MLRAAVAFFILGLIAFILGANNVAGMSVELGKILLLVFVSLAVIGYFVSLATGRRDDQIL